MDLLLMGAGIGVVGGLLPSPLHLIALAQVALNRWVRALAVLIGAPLIVDGALLALTFFFFKQVPFSLAHYLAYVGGSVALVFGSYSLIQKRRQGEEELSRSASLSYASVTAALLAEVAAPGTWIYWITIAGPVIAEGRVKGFWHVVPFFAGGLSGYYGASVVSVAAMNWGAGLHRVFKENLYLFANILLILLGISYLVRAFFSQPQHGMA